MQNFVRFGAIEFEVRLSQEFGVKQIAATFIELYISKLHHCYLQLLYVYFCSFLTNRNRDNRIPKVLEKV